MLKTDYKKFIIALLLLAFTSQTMATAAMTCQLEKATHAVAFTMDMTDPAMVHMHHHMGEISAHDMPAMNGMDHSRHTNSFTDKDPISDCCKTMGHCLLGGCSLAAASNNVTFLLAKPNSVAVDFYVGIAPAPLISSLYRPPISC